MAKLDEQAREPPWHGRGWRVGCGSLEVSRMDGGGIGGRRGLYGGTNAPSCASVQVSRWQVSCWQVSRWQWLQDVAQQPGRWRNGRQLPVGLLVQPADAA